MPFANDPRSLGRSEGYPHSGSHRRRPYFFFFFAPCLGFGAMKSQRSYVFTLCSSPYCHMYSRSPSMGLPSRAVWAYMQPPEPESVPPTENGQVPSPNLK